MPLVISDETLRAAGMGESDARIELACLLFDAGRLTIGYAAAFAGLDERAFEDELHRRGFPRHRYTDDKLRNDVEALKKLGRW